MSLLHVLEKSIDAWFSWVPRRCPTLLETHKMRLVAHRGAHDDSLRILENTDAAFQRALDLKCWGIEFDVHTCADKTLVVHHDPTLVRLWKKKTSIAELNFLELRKRVPQIPALKEVVQKYGQKMHLFIEVKSPFMAVDSLYEQLQFLKPCVDYHVLTLDEALLPLLNQKLPREALLLVAVHNNVKRFCELSIKEGYGGVLGHYVLLNDRTINALKLMNQKVGVGFVDSRYGLYRELNRGVDLLFSNDVGRVMEVWRRLQYAEEPSKG